MAKVVEVRLIENCLDSSAVKELCLDTPLDEGIMKRVSSQGTLQYFPDFPRPYFRVDRSRTYVLQGVLGNRSFRVTFSPMAAESAEAELVALVEQE